MGLLATALKMAASADSPSDRPDTGVPAALTGSGPTEAGGADPLAPNLGLANAQDPSDRPLAPESPAATIPAAGIDERLEVMHQSSGPVAEQFRAIRTSILARWRNQRHIVHAFTSAQGQEGKTLTVLNLGLSFAELSDRRTLVLEADFRRPRFASFLGLPAGPGLVDLLGQSATLAQTVVTLADTRLDVIPAGRIASHKALRVLSSPAAAALLGELRRRYDHVLIDTPAVLPCADAGVLGAASDEVILVARLDQTPEATVRQAIATLAGYNAPVAGLIVTDHALAMPIFRISSEITADAAAQEKDAA